MKNIEWEIGAEGYKARKDARASQNEKKRKAMIKSIGKSLYLATAGSVITAAAYLEERFLQMRAKAIELKRVRDGLEPTTTVADKYRQKKAEDEELARPSGDQLTTLQRWKRRLQEEAASDGGTSIDTIAIILSVLVGGAGCACPSIIPSHLWSPETTDAAPDGLFRCY